MRVNRQVLDVSLLLLSQHHSARLEEAGFLNERGQPFNPKSILAMVSKGYFSEEGNPMWATFKELPPLSMFVNGVLVTAIVYVGGMLFALLKADAPAMALSIMSALVFWGATIMAIVKATSARTRA